MADRLAGQVTLLFTDIEGSTSLINRLGSGYPMLLADHRRLLRSAATAYGGREIDSPGDGFQIAFAGPSDAVAAAVEAQRALTAHPWPDGASVRVRMGVHTGLPTPTSEGYAGIDVHRAARIAEAGHGGQVLLSQEAAEQVQGRLPAGVEMRDLGFHRLRDIPKPERLFQLALPNQKNDFPALRTPRGLSNNLRAHISSFVGREGELLAIRKLLNVSRLVTLSGPGGIGKSRLALAVAEGLTEAYADGVWLVELASLTEPGLVAATIGKVLSIQEEAGTAALETLATALATRRPLVLLDNCEHLAEECAFISERLLSSCPDLRILATSREALRIAGEHLYHVPPLGVPLDEQASERAGVLQYSAVRLFVDRASYASPGFTITAQNTGAIVQICRAVDGIPLALELAAARVPVLTPELLAARISDRFRLLTGGLRTAPPRQQSLRATIDWSYELLSPAEQSLLARISVFAGGLGLEAVEAIWVVDAGESEPLPVLDLLHALIGKSLVAVQTGKRGEPRYRLLESIRQYAAERLSVCSDEQMIRSRHRDYYLQLTETAAAELIGPNQARWLDRIEMEHDNCRTALGWSIGQGEAIPALRLATALGRFWEKRGYLSEGREWLERTLTFTEAAPLDLRARHLEYQGRLARLQGAYAEAAPLLQSSLSLYRELDDKPNVASVLTYVGIIALRQGDYVGARPFQEEALALYQEIGDKRGAGAALLNLGNIARREGDHSRAVALREQSLDLYRAAGDKQGVATALLNLGVAAADAGDYDRAAGIFEAALAIGRELGDWFAISRNLFDLAATHMRQGRLQRAVELCSEALEICHVHGDSAGIASCFEVLAATATECGDAARGARLLGAAVALRERIHAPLAAEIERRLRDVAASKARELLGDDTYELEERAGRTANLSEILVYALEVPTGV